MSHSSDHSPRGSIANPTLVNVSRDNSKHHASYEKDLEHGHITHEKDFEHPHTLKRSGTSASAAFEAAMTGEAPAENLDISEQDKARLDADPNVVDWQENDPLYVPGLVLCISLTNPYPTETL